MKLYTEEQVLNTIKAVLEYDNEVRIEKHLKALKPIELPSEIDAGTEAWTNINAKKYSDLYDAFVAGAKWMKEQILNQNK